MPRWPFISLKLFYFLYVTVFSSHQSKTTFYSHSLPIYMMGSGICFHVSRFPTGLCIPQPPQHPPPEDVTQPQNFEIPVTLATLFFQQALIQAFLLLVIHNLFYNPISSVFTCREPRKGEKMETRRELTLPRSFNRTAEQGEGPLISLVLLNPFPPFHSQNNYLAEVSCLDSNRISFFQQMTETEALALMPKCPVR